MKKILSLGKTLSKSDLKTVIGGTYGCIPLGKSCNPIGIAKCCSGQCQLFSTPTTGMVSVCR